MQDILSRLYGRAADKAGSIKGLKGRAKYAAECARSCAIQVERMVCTGLTQEQLIERLNNHE